MLYLLLDSSDSSLAVAAQVASWALGRVVFLIPPSSSRYSYMHATLCAVVCGHVEAPFGIVRLVRSFGAATVASSGLLARRGPKRGHDFEFV